MIQWQLNLICLIVCCFRISNCGNSTNSGHSSSSLHNNSTHHNSTHHNSTHHNTNHPVTHPIAHPTAHHTAHPIAHPTKNNLPIQSTHEHQSFLHQQHTKRIPGRSPCYHENSTSIICYPSYSIIGLPKSGTSSLHMYLHFHPLIKNLIPKEVCSSELKGVQLANGKWSTYTSDNEPYMNKIRSAYSYLSVNDTIFGETCVGLAEYGILAKYEYEKYLPHSSLKILLIRSPLESLYSAYWYFCSPAEFSGQRGEDVAAYCREFLRPDQITSKSVWENKNGYTFPRSPEDFHKFIQTTAPNRNMAIFTQPVSIKSYDLYNYVKESIQVFGKHNVMVVHTEELYEKTSEVLNNITRHLDLPPFNYSEAEKVNFNTYNTEQGSGHESRTDRQRASHPKMLPETFEYAKPFLEEECLLVEKYVPRACYYWLNDTLARPDSSPSS